MLSSNEDVGDGSLATDLVEGLLELGTIGFKVELDNLDVGDVERAEQSLGLVAVWAVGLRGKEDNIRGDEGLGFLKSGSRDHFELN